MTIDDNSTAEDIADDLLYRTGQGLKLGDYKLFRPCFAIPNMIETGNGKYMIATERQLFDTFSEVRQYHMDNLVADIARIVLSSQFIDAQTIGSTHATRLIRDDGSLFLKPYPVYSIIRFSGVRWEIVSSIYAILDSPQLNDALKPRYSGLDQH